MSLTPPPAGPPSATTAAGLPVIPYRWVVLFSLCAANWAMTLPTLSLGLLLPEIDKTFGINDTQGGWLGASIRIGPTLMMLPAALMMSRFNPLHMTSLSLAFGAFFTFLHGLSPSLAVLFIARVGFGFTLAVRWPARAVLTQLWHPLSEAPLATGIIVALTGIAEFLVLLLTPILLNVTGDWRMVYHLYAFFGVGVFLFWVVFGRSRGLGIEHPLASAGRSVLGVVLRYRPAWVIGIGAFGGTFGWASFGTFWPIFMLEDHNVPLTQTGWLFGIVSLTTIPPALAVGLYAPRIRNWRVVVTAAGLVMTGGLFGMLVTTDIWLLALFAICRRPGMGLHADRTHGAVRDAEGGGEGARGELFLHHDADPGRHDPRAHRRRRRVRPHRLAVHRTGHQRGGANRGHGERPTPRPPRRGPTRLGVGPWAFVDVVPADARTEVHQRNRRHHHRKQPH